MKICNFSVLLKKYAPNIYSQILSLKENIFSLAIFKLIFTNKENLIIFFEVLLIR